MAQSISKSPKLPNCKRSKLSIKNKHSSSFLAATEAWCFLLTNNGLAYYDVCLAWDIAYGIPDPYL